MMSEKQYNINDHLLSIVWLLFLILPNNQFFFLFVPIAYIILFRFKNEEKLNVTTFIGGFVLLSFATFLFNIHTPHVGINTTKDISRLLVLMISFITFGRLRGDVILKPYIYFAIAYLVISQFAYIWNIAPLKSLFSIYKDEEGESMSGINNYVYGAANVRLGGMFFNSNQYSRYLELIMLVLMCEIKQFSKKSLMILCPIIIISLGATGSRTSLVVFCIAVVFYLYSAKIFSPGKTKIISIVFVVSLLFVYLFTGLSKMRVFKINEGLDNSFGQKLGLLITYLDSNPNIIKLIFGNLSSKVMFSSTGTISMDWEIGNILFVYGIVFFIFLFVFYFTLFKRYLPKYRVVFVILLWMFTSSILFSYRMASLWILVLGLYYRRSLIEKKQLKINNYDKRI